MGKDGQIPQKISSRLIRIQLKTTLRHKKNFVHGAEAGKNASSRKLFMYPFTTMLNLGNALLKRKTASLYKPWFVDL